MGKKIMELYQILSKRDIDILHSIYRHRCLTTRQIHLLHHDVLQSLEDVERLTARDIGRTQRRINLMIQHKLLKETVYAPNASVYFLTPSGVEMLKHIKQFPLNIYDEKKKILRRGYWRASELEMHLKNINHQVHLNDFIVHLPFRLPHAKFRYYDAKFIEKYPSVMPDGLLSFVEHDFLVEWDMGTESAKQLAEKWEHYRRFLLSNEFVFRDRKLSMLFILTDKNLANRKRVVKHTLHNGLLDLLHCHASDFDIVVGGEADITDYLHSKILHLNPQDNELMHAVQSHGFWMVPDFHFSDTLHYSEPSTTEFDYYGYRPTETRGSRGISREHNALQEFIIDDGRFDSTTVYAKIAYWSQINRRLYDKHGRFFRYLIIAKDEESIFQDLHQLNLLHIDHVYYSTLERLQDGRGWSRALFRFDSLGNLFHFANTGLAESIFERTVALSNDGR